MIIITMPRYENSELKMTVACYKSGNNDDKSNNNDESDNNKDKVNLLLRRWD